MELKCNYTVALEFIKFKTFTCVYMYIHIPVDEEVLVYKYLNT